MTDKIRVLELGSGVSAAYAAKLLGDQGADVVKVESGRGDRTRHMGPYPNDDSDPDTSGLFLALNSNKRGVYLDFAGNQGMQHLRRLIEWADILVHNYSRIGALELGLDPVDAGPLRMARNIEAMMALYMVPLTQGRGAGWEFYFRRTNFWPCNEYTGGEEVDAGIPTSDAGNLAEFPETQGVPEPCPQ